MEHTSIDEYLLLHKMWLHHRKQSIDENLWLKNVASSWKRIN